MFIIAIDEAKPCKFVYCGVLIEFFFLIGKAFQRDEFNIYLYSLARISHLLVGLGLIGWLCWSLRKQSQPFEDAIEALDAASVTTLAKPVPQLGKTELWIAPLHISDELQLIRSMLVRVMMRAFGLVGKRFSCSVPACFPEIDV